jgi:hypothetical protein
MVTIRPREDWQSPSQPVVGPAMQLWSVELLPAHYTAANTIPDDIPAYLRSIQNDYTVNRGYSIGYNFAVDQTGTAWELRGFDFKCAANKDMNEVTIAVLCLVDGAEAMNPAMVDTFQGVGAECVRVAGRPLFVVGHRDIGSTSCPGDGIYGQVVSGQLEPDDTQPEPGPEPRPPQQGDLMFTILDITGTDVAFGGNMDANGIAAQVTWLNFARYEACINLGAPIVEANPGDLVNCDLLGPIPPGFRADQFANVIS